MQGSGEFQCYSGIKKTRSIMTNSCAAPSWRIIFLQPTKTPKIPIARKQGTLTSTHFPSLRNPSCINRPPWRDAYSVLALPAVGTAIVTQNADAPCAGCFKPAIATGWTSMTVTTEQVFSRSRMSITRVSRVASLTRICVPNTVAIACFLT
ncbi:hypothetical protein D3C81_1841440 [compost metagenome]